MVCPEPPVLDPEDDILYVCAVSQEILPLVSTVKVCFPNITVLVLDEALDTHSVVCPQNPSVFTVVLGLILEGTVAKVALAAICVVPDVPVAPVKSRCTMTYLPHFNQ